MDAVSTILFLLMRKLHFAKGEVAMGLCEPGARRSCMDGGPLPTWPYLHPGLGPGQLTRSPWVPVSQSAHIPIFLMGKSRPTFFCCLAEARKAPSLAKKRWSLDFTGKISLV